MLLGNQNRIFDTLHEQTLIVRFALFIQLEGEMPFCKVVYGSELDSPKKVILKLNFVFDNELSCLYSSLTSLWVFPFSYLLMAVFGQFEIPLFLNDPLVSCSKFSFVRQNICVFTITYINLSKSIYFIIISRDLFDVCLVCVSLKYCGWLPISTLTERNDSPPFTLKGAKKPIGILCCVRFANLAFGETV